MEHHSMSDTTVPPADTAPAETPAPAAPPAAPPAPAAPAAAAAPAEPAADAQTFGAEYVEKLRRESATYRTKAKEAADAQAAVLAEKAQVEQQAAQFKAILDGITKAVNGDTDEPADPAKLAEQLAAEKAQRESDVAALTAEHNAKIRDLTVRATLPGVLAKAGADPDLTTAVLTAGGVLSNLDPGSDTFAADLASAVAAAVEANPKLKVAPVATRSGAEITGRSGGSDQVTREQLSRMSSAEIEKARVDGRLKSLLGGG
jgi:hypothetical protein